MQILKSCLLVILASAISLSTSIFAEEDKSSLLKEFDFSTRIPSYELIDSSFDDLCKIFGKTRTISDAQREELWNEYEGKYVRWQGIVTYKGIGEQDWKRVGIRHNLGTNVEILFDDDKKRIVGMINSMDIITYTGKLSQFFDRNLMFELVDAAIEKINGVSAEEYIVNRHNNSSKEYSREAADRNSEDKSTSAYERRDVPDENADFTFDELDTIFGKNSSLSFAQKEKLWNKFQGKSVLWRGIVTYNNSGKTNLHRIGIRHTTGTNIEFVLDEDKIEENVAELIKRGDDITYTGELAKLFGRNLLCSIVNVEIQKIGEKSLLDKKGEKSSQANSDFSADADKEKEDTTDIIIAESMAPEVIQKDELEIITTQEGFIKTPFQEIEAIFGNKSRLTESQKDKLWKEYQGKLVRWQGRVVNRGLGRVSGLRMGVSHSDITDVELCFNITMKDKVLSTKTGDLITYTGRLDKRRGYILPYRIEDGYIEQIMEVQQSTDSAP
ncbi:MAG: hypothetical protein MRK01_14475 [Candidatus Scalindua sp.]|nr:hypothetical protein [Candidatus Scalindua sp.]